MVNIIVGAITGISGSLLAWLAFNWIGKPVLDVRSKRLETLQVIELHGYTGYGSSEANVNASKAALSDIAMYLRSFARAQPWTARLYCRVLHYDMEFAASAIIGLADLVGENLPAGSTTRRDNVDAVYMALNAHQHMTPERIQTIKDRIFRAKEEVRVRARVSENPSGVPRAAIRPPKPID